MPFLVFAGATGVACSLTPVKEKPGLLPLQALLPHFPIRLGDLSRPADIWVP